MHMKTAPPNYQYALSFVDFTAPEGLKITVFIHQDLYIDINLITHSFSQKSSTHPVLHNLEYTGMKLN